MANTSLFGSPPAAGVPGVLFENNAKAGKKRQKTARKPCAATAIVL